MKSEDFDGLLEEMILHQRRKVFGVARELVPALCEDDLFNPHDLPALAHDMAFNYEDGILAGYLAVQAAVRARRAEASHKGYN